MVEVADGRVALRGLVAPAFSDGGAQGGREYLAPRTEVERALAVIWEELLGHPRVGVHDNFLELGGHSLLATRLVSAVRQRLSAEVQLRAVFEARTLEAMAKQVEKASRTQLPPLVRAERAGPLFLSFAQQRLWFIHQLEPASAAYHIAGVVPLEGVFDAEALRRSLGALVARHEPLRTTFGVVEGQPVQVVREAMEVDVPLMDVGGEVGEGQRRRAEALAAEWARVPFDLEQGPLLRVGVIRLSEEKHLLVVVMHHIISDGWSIGVMTREWMELYRVEVDLEEFQSGETRTMAE